MRPADPGRAGRHTARVRKWRCEASACERSIFAERLPGLASPHAHQSDAVADILAVMGYGAGGETSSRLLDRLGITVSGGTVLRHLKRRSHRRRRAKPLRVVGVDERSWRRGAACGTILVDLETRTVADVLPDRFATSLATWLSQHPGVEIVCRDRHGLYAEGARVGAPQTKQVADRFHLVQNLHDRIEQHLSGQRQRPIGPIEGRQGGAERANLDRADRLEGLQRLFARVHDPFRQGWTAADISRHLDINRRRVDKWVRLEARPERVPCDPKPTSPMRFHAPLQELMREGVTKMPGFAAIRHLAIRFQILLRCHNETKLDRWLADAKDCGKVPHDHRQLSRGCDSRDVLSSSSGNPPKESPQRPWGAIRLSGSLYQHASGM